MKQLLSLLVFSVLCLSLWAVHEVEPNGYIGAEGIQWATNGIHTGESMIDDFDIWRLYGLAGDVVNISVESQLSSIILHDADGTVIGSSMSLSDHDLDYSFQESKSIFLRFYLDQFIHTPYQFQISGQSYTPQIPLMDGFTPDEFLFNSKIPACHWERSLLPSCPQNLALCNAQPGQEGILEIATGIDLNNYPAPYLEFKHICYMPAGGNKGFVEYSVDGGNIWTVFPASALPWANNYTDEHPWFDTDHSPIWADWETDTDYELNWVTSRFNLSQWDSCEDFRIRFRAEWQAGTYLPTGRFWALDYVKLSQDAPSVPVITYPANMAMNVPTGFRITWSAQNATSYDIRIFSPGGTTMETHLSTNYLDVDLDPSVDYHIMVKANNQSGSSEWSSMGYSFRTNDYETVIYEGQNAYISSISIDDFQRDSGYDGYYYNHIAEAIPLSQGAAVPLAIEVSGPGVIVSISLDSNQNNVFEEDEILFFDSWGTQFQGTLQIPINALTGTTRLRAAVESFDQFPPANEIEDYAIQILPAPGVQVNPNQVSFEPVLSGYPSTEMQIELSNPGAAPLTIDALEIGGSDAAYFSIATELSFPLTINQSPYTLDLVYHPLAVGEHSANLSISSNAVNTLAPITLSGSSVAPNLSGALHLNAYANKYVAFSPETQAVVHPALCLEAWIRWEDDSAQCIISKGEGKMEISTTDMSGVRFAPTPGVEIISNHFVLEQSAWTHIACVYDPSAMLAKIYIDGIDWTWQNTGSAPLSQPIIDNGEAWQIGRNSVGSNYFTGSLADIRVWGTARSLEEIRNNMHLLQDPQPPALLANWRFDEPFGFTVYDSVHNQHGTLVNCLAQDRFDAPVTMGSGISETQYAEAGTSTLFFADCGLELSDMTITAPASVTVTRMLPSGQRNDLQENHWLLNHFFTLTGTATISFHLDDDLGPEHLPETDFLLLTHGIINSLQYPEARAAAVDLDLDTVSFTNLSLVSRAFHIVREPMQAPSDLQIAEHASGLRLSWTAALYAQGYKIYSSDNPEGPFETIEAEMVYGTFWNIDASAERKFFKVVSVVQ